MTENKLICPFCQQELRQDQDGYYTCYTDNCGCMVFGGNGASGSESLWLALIDIKKKLDIAVATLQEIDGCCEDNKYNDILYIGLDGHDTRNVAEDVKKALEQITALEQKDVK